MKNHIITFVVSLVLGFAIGALGFNLFGSATEKASEETNVAKTESASKEEADDTKAEQTESTASAGDSILAQKNCLSCHAVSKLNLDGGTTGPDLSQAYANIEGKHGKPLDEFLKEPTSAVMSTVIAGAPLTDEEINQIVEELKKAAEQ